MNKKTWLGVRNQYFENQCLCFIIYITLYEFAVKSFMSNKININKFNLYINKLIKI